MNQQDQSDPKESRPEDTGPPPSPLSTATGKCEACKRTISAWPKHFDAGGALLCEDCASHEPLYVGFFSRCRRCGHKRTFSVEFTGRKEQRWPPYWLTRGECPACRERATARLTRIPYTTDLEFLERPEGEPEFDGVRFLCHNCSAAMEVAVEHMPGPLPTCKAWFRNWRCPKCKQQGARLVWIPYVEGMIFVGPSSEVSGELSYYKWPQDPPECPEQEEDTETTSEPAPFHGRTVFRQLPADWPYPPEEGYGEKVAGLYRISAHGYTAEAPTLQEAADLLSAALPLRPGESPAARLTKCTECKGTVDPGEFAFIDGNTPRTILCQYCFPLKGGQLERDRLRAHVRSIRRDDFDPATIAAELAKDATGPSILDDAFDVVRGLVKYILDDFTYEGRCWFCNTTETTEHYAGCLADQVQRFLSHASELSKAKAEGYAGVILDNAAADTVEVRIPDVKHTNVSGPGTTADLTGPGAIEPEGVGRFADSKYCPPGVTTTVFLRCGKCDKALPEERRVYHVMGSTVGYICPQCVGVNLSCDEIEHVGPQIPIEELSKESGQRLTGAFDLDRSNMRGILLGVVDAAAGPEHCLLCSYQTGHHQDTCVIPVVKEWLEANTQKKGN